VEKIIEIKRIPRIEGHLDFDVKITNNQVLYAHAKAVEGTRILEKILIGKNYWEVPEITSRMCGVCHAIHKLTAVQAIENAFNLEVPEDAILIRKLIAIGGHIQSHLLHLHFFVLPDCFDVESILDLININRELVLKVIKLKKFSNDIIERLGGTMVHPIVPIVGGLSRPPRKSTLLRIKENLNEMKKLAIPIVDAIFNARFPKFERRTNYIALCDEKSIPLLNGFIASSNGLKFKPSEYLKYFIRKKESYSTALHYLLMNDESYMVGALSRLNINFRYLTDQAKEFCKKYNIKFPMYSPFANNIAQALEIIHFLNETEEILANLIGKKQIDYYTNFIPKAGDGVAATEAPRGLLIHHYRTDRDGRVVWANIITPTAQNLKNMEIDGINFVKALLGKTNNIKKEVEKLVRSYDPCISCAARFYREE